MSTVQKWLTGMIGLGALYLVLTNPEGFAKLAGGVKTITAGSETSIITGGRR